MNQTNTTKSHSLRRVHSRNFTLLAGLVVSAFLLGGGSRDDILSLLIWRPLSAMILALAAAWAWRDAWARGRPLLIYALAVVGLVLLHLVPLPPELWTSLPGRQMIADIYRDMDMALPWQPVSIAQGRTWNALFALAGPLAALILALSIGGAQHQQILKVLIGLGLLSGLLGLLQAIGPATGPLYFYRITNNGFAVGLFSNRNHQAMFMAGLFPLLAAYLSCWKGKPERWLFQKVVVAAIALFLVPLLLVTGSRAGIVLGIIGAALACWIYQSPIPSGRRSTPSASYRLLQIGSVAAVVGGLLLITVAASRAPALTRLLESGSSEEIRVQTVPVLLEASRSFFPLGSGIGSFVETYRFFEPDALLSPQYLNHAHNDYLEVLLTAGAPGVLLALAGLLLIGIAALGLLRKHRDSRWGREDRSELTLGRAGLSILVLLALGSLSDYPLRVPSLAVLASISAAWAMIGYRKQGSFGLNSPQPESASTR